MPYYAEECASMLAVTFSSSSGDNSRDIVSFSKISDLICVFILELVQSCANVTILFRFFHSMF